MANFSYQLLACDPADQSDDFATWLNIRPVGREWGAQPAWKERIRAAIPRPVFRLHGLPRKNRPAFLLRLHRVSDKNNKLLAELIDQLAASVDRAQAAVTDALTYVEASNKRIDDLESHSGRTGWCKLGTRENRSASRH